MRLKHLFLFFLLSASSVFGACKVTVTGNLAGPIASNLLKPNLKAVFRISADLTVPAGCSGTAETVYKSASQTRTLTDPTNFTVDLHPNIGLSGLVPVTTQYEVELHTRGGKVYGYLQVPYSSSGRTWAECAVSVPGDPSRNPAEKTGDTFTDTMTFSPPSGSPHYQMTTDNVSPTTTNWGVGSTHFDGARLAILDALNNLRKLAFLDDTMTPAAHASSHENGGADEVSVEGLSGDLADAQDAKPHGATHGVSQTDPISITKQQVSDFSHASTHENGNGDEISVEGLSGDLADAQDPKTHASSHQHGGADEVATATAGANAIPKAEGDGKLNAAWLDQTDINYGSISGVPSSFNPSAHASTHQHSGSDEIATATAAANAIPKADGDGKLNGNWLDDTDVDVSLTTGNLPWSRVTKTGSLLSDIETLNTGTKAISSSDGTVDITGNVTATGGITAPIFYGDGSALTGIDTSAAMSTLDDYDVSGNTIDMNSGTLTDTDGDVDVAVDLTVAGKILGAAGSAAAPGWSWSTDPDTGFYRAAGDEMRVSIGGTYSGRWSLGSLGIHRGGGATVTFTSTASGTGEVRASDYLDVNRGQDTGMDVETASTLKLKIDNVDEMTGTTTKWTVPTNDLELTAGTLLTDGWRGVTDTDTGIDLIGGDVVQLQLGSDTIDFRVNTGTPERRVNGGSWTAF